MNFSSRKNVPPSYTEWAGPRTVATHSNRLSSLGPPLNGPGGGESDGPGERARKRLERYSKDRN